MLARALFAAALLTAAAPVAIAAETNWPNYPPSKETHGHFTHYYAAVWKPYLIDFINRSDLRRRPRNDRSPKFHH